VDRNREVVASRGKVTRVAPFTGAWIETANSGGMTATINVAPFTGAWIETGG